MSDEPTGNNAAAGDLPGDDLIEIHDPEVDPQALMAEIKKRILKRRVEMGYDQKTFPTFGGMSPMPEPPAGVDFDPEFWDHLRQANELYAEFETAAVLLPSSATRVPFLGRLWQLIRRQAHELVLYYVNRVLAQQVSVNRHLVSTVNLLTQQNQEQQKLIMDLQARLSQDR